MPWPEWDLSKSRGTTWGTNTRTSSAYDPGNYPSGATVATSAPRGSGGPSTTVIQGGNRVGSRTNPLDVLWGLVSNRNGYRDTIAKAGGGYKNMFLGNKRTEARASSPESGRPLPPPSLQGMEILGVDPNSLFEQYYKGMKDYESIGLASTRDSQKALADLKARMAQSTYGLEGDLSGIKEAELFNILAQDKKMYGTEASEIQRMKEYLLTALGERNAQRSSQRGYYEGQRTFVEQALESALAQSLEDKAAGGRLRDVNIREILSNATARGAAGSMGTETGRADQKAQFEELVTTLERRDTNARIDRDKSMADIANAIKMIEHEQQQDITKWREDNAGLDTDRAQLDIERDAGGFRFMSQVAQLRAQAAEAQRQRDFQNQMLALEKQRADAEYAAGIQRAQQSAFMGAANQWQMWDQARFAHFGQMDQRQLAAEYGAALRAGNYEGAKYIAKFINAGKPTVSPNSRGNAYARRYNPFG